ncbi:MAG: serine hydrolase [Flavobacteriales bacterium]|nr:serine hydrolase [Flavobacteriales bacterium]
MSVVFLALLLLNKASAQSLYFPPLAGNTWETTPPATLNWCPEKIDSLYDFLENTNTKAFLVLKDGKVVLEKYFAPFTQDSVWYWASAGKTITALLTGVAQEEGSLNIQNPSSDYLGTGWSSLTSQQESAIKVWHHLTMTTGLDDSVPELDCYLPSCLTYLAAPGTRWSYHNAPYTLLDSIIQMSTGQTLNNYTNSRLKNKTGMTGLWVKVGYNTVFFSKARSMARFGILIQNRGKWNNQTVLGDTAYFNQMTTTSQNLNLAYGYLWWLNGTASYMLPYIQTPIPGNAMPDAPSDMIAALGKNGQILNVSPSTGFVVVRMGNLPTENVFVPNVYNNQIWQRINDLSCSNSSIQETQADASFAVFPNPVTDVLHITTGNSPGMIRYAVIDSKGATLLRGTTGGKIDVSAFAPGNYFVLTEINNQKVTRQFVKN